MEGSSAEQCLELLVEFGGDRAELVPPPVPGATLRNGIS